MMTHRFRAAVFVVFVSIAAPSHAVVITEVQVKSAIPDFLQIAELQLFADGTNVALGGTTTGTSYGFGDSPSKTIDGSTDGTYPNIFHSQTNNGSEVFTLTLASAFDVTSLTIFGRTDCCESRDLYNFFLFDGSTQVGSGTLDARSGPATVTFASAVPAVPEPATWAMMLLGFGFIGGTMRSAKRRQKVTISYA